MPDATRPEEEAAPLTSLSLQSHNLSELPVSVLALTTLQTLDLSRNMLCLLPVEIAELQAHTLLDVSRNWLRTLPAELSQLPALHTINALGNKFNHRTLPLERLAQTPSLRLLDLRFQKTDKCRRAAAAQAMQQHFPARIEVRLDGAADAPLPHAERGIVGAHACDRDARLLRSQLEPWGTPALRARLAGEFSESTDPEVGGGIQRVAFVAQWHCAMLTDGRTG